MKAYQHMKAPNDVNGNPRRLYMVYETGWQYAIDEGYGGFPAHLYNGNYRELLPVNITATEYKKLLVKYADKLEGYRQ